METNGTNGYLLFICCEQIVLASLNLRVQQVTSQLLDFISFSADKVDTQSASEIIALGFRKPVLPAHQSHGAE